MNLIKKVSIVLLCMIVFSFCVPTCVKAGSDADIGGKLLNPIMCLVVAIGDGVMSLIQNVTVGMSNTFLELNTDVKDQNVLSAIGEWFSDNWEFVVAGVLAVGAVVVNVIPVAGQAASVAMAVAAYSLAAGAVAMTVYGFVDEINDSMLPDTLVLPTYAVTPKAIFANEIPMIDVDFFNPSDSRVIQYFDDEGNEQTTLIRSSSKDLQKTVSRWYQIIRDIAIVASLSIFVYVGIRILISSTSGDKAKYKQMIVDWVVALCLLFVMQYIMSFSNIIVDKILDLIDSINTNNYDSSSFEGYDETYTITTIEEGFQLYQISDEETVYNAYLYLVEGWAESNEKTEKEAPMRGYFTVASGHEDDDNPGAENATQLLWPAKNEMEQARINSQLLFDEKETYESIGYKLIYFVMVIFTCIFLFTYARRVLYMAFLTMVAPLVAMTYPIDKINDGNAQAFNMWLKEYIFNLLLQPMHLILYTVLIGSAMNLASSNIVYTACALGFMIPAEKLMRKFFGFEKAQTPGMLNGAAGAALMMSGMNKLLKGTRSSGSKDSSGKHGKSDSDKEDTKINMHDKFDSEEQFGAPRQNEDDDDDDERFRRHEDGGGDDDDDDDDPPPVTPPSIDIDDDDSPGDPTRRREDLDEDDDDDDDDDYDDDEPAENNDYLEDRIKNFIKGSNTYDRARRVKEATANFGRNAIETVGSGLNKVKDKLPKIKGVKKLPKSRILEKGAKTSKKLAKAGGRAARFYARGLGNKISDKIVNGQWGRKAVRFAGGAALGAAAAATAAGIGIASGDPSKMAQYAGTAAAGGYITGSRGVDKTANALKVDGVKDVAREEYYGKDELKKIEQRKAYQQKKQDLKFRWKLEDKIGKEKAKEFMNGEDGLKEVLKFGDFNDDTLVAIAQISSKDKTKRDNAIAAALISERYLDGKDSRTLGDKAKSEFEKTIKRRGKERGLEGDELEQFNIRTQKAIKELDKYRFD